MNNETDLNKGTTANQQVGVDVDTYDRGIVPAETAARKEREGSQFKTTPAKTNQEKAETDDQTNAQSLDTTDGYTVDKEGLVNNYAIEPEMYVNEPGDLRPEEQVAAERAQELKEINQDSEGKLTDEADRRGRGPGLV